MAAVTVNGDVLWIKQLHGDSRLRERLGALPGGEDVELIVDGVQGHFQKMRDGKDGRPTQGLAPRGRMQAFWRGLLETRRGEDVPVLEPQSTVAAGVIYPAMARTEAERMAALEQLLSIKGWSSGGWKFSREEIYDERADELEERRLRSRP